MVTKLKSKDPLAFLSNYSVSDLKQAITEAVAELAKEYANLAAAEERPRPLTEADKIVMNTQREDLTTVDLAKNRIAYWENVQDRLWNWYRKRTNPNGEATELADQGGSSLG